MRDTPISILDEPTSALDVTTEAKVWHNLEERLRGRTALVIAHRLSTARRCDRILVIEDGAIIEQGPHEELMARRGAYFDLWQRPRRRGRGRRRPGGAVGGCAGASSSILGMMGRCPFGGQTWLYLNWLRGFQRLGHEVWYVEDDTTWPYDPARHDHRRPGYAARYLAAPCPRIGLGDRWAYRPLYRGGRRATGCRSAACAISTGGATR